MTHDSVQYEPIQGPGNDPLKVANSAIFKGYLLTHLEWRLANENAFLN